MDIFSTKYLRDVIKNVSYHDTVTIGGGIREIRLTFGEVAPNFWKVWKVVQGGSEKEREYAYADLSKMLFGEDSQEIICKEGASYFFVWLHHYTQNRVLPFMHTCEKALGATYLYGCAEMFGLWPPKYIVRRVRLRLLLSAAIAKAKKYQ